MEINSKILITGGTGMVGSAVTNLLRTKGFENITQLSSKDLDLRDKQKVNSFFEEQKFDYVIHLAAKVGGIKSNIKFPVEYLYDNMIMSFNVITAAKEFKVKKLLNLGSSCIYPKGLPQPMKEEDLMTDKLEPTNEGYSLAKIAALKLCDLYNKEYKTNFINLVPCNLYGPKDKFDDVESHVIPALISKLILAKNNNQTEVEIWGSGNARREFLFVEDLADAIVYFMENINATEIDSFVNIGFGKDISIKDLVYLIKDLIQYTGKILFDTSKPEGMKQKLLNVSKSKELNWVAKTDLRQGLIKTITWYKQNK